MINRDDYLIELPNLKIDQQDIDKLVKMVDDLSEYWIEYVPDIKVPGYPKSGDTYYSPSFNWGCWLKYPGILEHPLVKEWIGRLPAGLNVTNSSVMKSKPWFELTPHQDKRDASFLIVLTPNPAPVYFLDGKDELVLEHTYACPTIINTHITHGVNNFSDFDRITFQLGITQPWEEVVKILKDSTLT
jgi:hypothetical protein